MIKYTVAPATTVLNKAETWKVRTLEYDNQIIMQNAEISDTTRSERLGVATRELNMDLPNVTPIACGTIHRPSGPPPVHVLNASSGMSGSCTANDLRKLDGRNTLHSEPTVGTQSRYKVGAGNGFGAYQR